MKHHLYRKIDVQHTHWRTVRLFLSYLGFLITTTSSGLPQLKDLTDWVRGVKESTIVREYSFIKTGKIEIDHGRGDIKIKGWSLPKVALQMVMRFSAPTTWLPTIEYHETKLHIDTTNAPSAIVGIDVQLMVPHACCLDIKAHEGNVAVKKIESPLHIVSHTGAITIKNSSASVKAYASDDLYAQFDLLPMCAHCEFSSANGALTISLPQSVHAQIQATTIGGEIYCDHFVTLSQRTTRLNKHTWQEMQRNIHALIGNGGTMVKLSAYKGIRITY